LISNYKNIKSNYGLSLESVSPGSLLSPDSLESPAFDCDPLGLADPAAEDPEALEDFLEDLLNSLPSKPFLAFLPFFGAGAVVPLILELFPEGVALPSLDPFVLDTFDVLGFFVSSLAPFLIPLASCAYTKLNKRLITKTREMKLFILPP
jgi:hypothetical protein